MRDPVARVVRVESAQRGVRAIRAQRQVHGIEARLDAGPQLRLGRRQRAAIFTVHALPMVSPASSVSAGAWPRSAPSPSAAQTAARADSASNYCVRTSNVAVYDARRFFTFGTVAFSSSTDASSQYMPAAGQVTADHAILVGLESHLVGRVTIARPTGDDFDVEISRGFAVEQEPESRRSRPHRDRWDAVSGASSSPAPTVFTSDGVPTVTKVSTRRCICSTSSFAAFAGMPVAISAGVPRQRFGLPSSSQRAITVSSATATRYVPGLPQLQIEDAARAALGGILRCDGLPSGAVITQRVDGHRALVDREQVVGHRRIDRHPAAGAREDRLRRQQPRARGRAHRGMTRAHSEREPSECRERCFHVSFSSHGLSDSATAPSSLLPFAVACFAALIGHSNGIRTASRPPTSRTASTTSAYCPGLSCASGACVASNFSRCWPTGRVAPVSPSTGTLRSRPPRRHHWRRSGSHLV